MALTDLSVHKKKLLHVSDGCTYFRMLTFELHTGRLASVQD